MMNRNPDGTWRGPTQAVKVSATLVRARWVEAESLRLKQMGLSFDEIARQITRVGRGQAAPMVNLPEGVTFPADYTISKQAIFKAMRRALAREPALAAEEYRMVDTMRCEEMFSNLQPAIRKGNPRSIETGIKVLRHAAYLNGYAAPQRHELTGKDGAPLTLVRLLEAAGPIIEEDEKSEK
jgi:hypothetical protein